MRKSVLAPLLFFWTLLLAGCTAPSPAASPPPTPSASPLLSSPTPALILPTAQAPAPTPTPDPIQALLSSMTTGQKVAQLLVGGIMGTTPGEDAVAAIQTYQVGGIILFGRNVETAPQLAQLTNDLKTLNGGYVPLFLCVDEEGGVVSRMPPELYDIPNPLVFGQTGNKTICARLGRLLGSECAAFGLNVNCAPSLDIWSNPNNTVIGERALAKTPADTATLGTAVWQGISDRDVIPVVKHFPGHGDTEVDSHVGLPVVKRSLAQLKERELVPFQAAIQAQVPAIMVAHVLEQGIDTEYPATLSHKVVSGLLREQMGFDGVVFTDDLTMAAISDTYGIDEAAVLAVEAGCDMLLVCHDGANLTAAYNGLLRAVQSNRISAQRLDESVLRILTLKENARLSNDPVSPPDVETLNAQVNALLALLNQ